MRLSRRRAFGVAAAVVAAPSVARLGWARVYPSGPVRVIVPVAAGGANDTTARLFMQRRSESLGQQFYVENLPGAGAGPFRRMDLGGNRQVVQGHSRRQYQRAITARDATRPRPRRGPPSARLFG